VKRNRHDAIHRKRILVPRGDHQLGQRGREFGPATVLESVGRTSHRSLEVNGRPHTDHSQRPDRAEGTSYLARSGIQSPAAPEAKGGYDPRDRAVASWAEQVVHTTTTRAKRRENQIERCTPKARCRCAPPVGRRHHAGPGYRIPRTPDRSTWKPAGPRSTSNREGKIRKTMGTTILTGASWAFFSAIWRRLTRIWSD